MIYDNLWIIHCLITVMVRDCLLTVVMGGFVLVLTVVDMRLKWTVLGIKYKVWGIKFWSKHDFPSKFKIHSKEQRNLKLWPWWPLRTRMLFIILDMFGPMPVEVDLEECRSPKWCTLINTENQGLNTAMHAYMHVCMHACMHACTHTLIQAYTHTSIHAYILLNR